MHPRCNALQAPSIAYGTGHACVSVRVFSHFVTAVRTSLCVFRIRPGYIFKIVTMSDGLFNYIYVRSIPDRGLILEFTLCDDDVPSFIVFATR